MRGQHERHALQLQPVEPVPDDVPSLRVEPGRRLIEQHQHWGGEERPRDGHLLLLPARKVAHRLKGALPFEAQPRENARQPPLDLCRREAVDPSEEEQVLDCRHVAEERGVRRHPVDQRPHLARLTDDVQPENASFSAVGQKQSAQNANQRALARSIRAQHSVDLAPLRGERNVAQHVRGALFRSVRPEPVEGWWQQTAVVEAAAEIFVYVSRLDCGCSHPRLRSTPHVLVHELRPGCRSPRRATPLSVRTFHAFVNGGFDDVSGPGPAGLLKLRFCVLFLFFFWRGICFSPWLLATKNPPRPALGG